MSKLTAIGMFVGIGLLVGMGVLAYGAYKNLMDENTKLRNEVVGFKQLTETLARASNKWVTKDDLKDNLADMLTPEDLAAVRTDIKRQGARLSAVGRTVGRISARITKLEESDRQGPENTEVVQCDDGRLVDTHAYTKRPQIKRVEDNNKAPVADVEFNAAKAKPWSYELFNREYNLATVISRRDSGQLIVHNNLTYRVPKFGDKKYPVPIVASEFTQAQLGSKFFWINPRMDISLFGGANVFSFASGPGNPDSVLLLGADLGISLSSYGRTKLDSWWRLFRIGLGYDARRNSGRLSFSPAMFNLGKSIPFLSNLYLGPGVGIDSAGGLGITINLGPQL